MRCWKWWCWPRLDTGVINSLKTLLNNWWEKQLVPEEWRKGVIVKVPPYCKKGNIYQTVTIGEVLHCYLFHSWQSPEYGIAKVLEKLHCIDKKL